MLLSTAAAFLSLLAPPKGDTPPPGPPWQTAYAAAKAQALLRGQPVFVYFTKTV